jgi:hypothetical protein
MCKLVHLCFGVLKTRSPYCSEFCAVGLTSDTRGEACLACAGRRTIGTMGDGAWAGGRGTPRPYGRAWCHVYASGVYSTSVHVLSFSRTVGWPRRRCQRVRVTGSTAGGRVWSARKKRRRGACACGALCFSALRGPQDANQQNTQSIKR